MLECRNQGFLKTLYCHQQLQILFVFYIFLFLINLGKSLWVISQFNEQPFIIDFHHICHIPLISKFIFTSSFIFISTYHIPFFTFINYAYLWGSVGYFCTWIQVWPDQVPIFSPPFSSPPHLSCSLVISIQILDQHCLVSM
jgi:hypothetical protein